MTHGIRALCVFTAAIAVFFCGSFAPAQNGKKKPKDDAPVIKDPLVLEVLESFDPEKSTPVELVEAVRILLDLRHPAVARRYVTKLAAAKLGDDELSKIGRKFGSAVLLKMSLADELKPEAGQFADRVQDATRRVARDPKRLAGFIDQLKSPSANDRAKAVRELAFGGDVAVNALVAVLADADRAEEHAGVGQALVGLDTHSTGPLTGALETTDVALKAQVIDVLRGLDARRAWLDLLAPALAEKSDDNVRKAATKALTGWLGRMPTREQAIVALAEQSRHYYGGGKPTRPDFHGNIALWRWDAAAKQAVRQTYHADDASMAVAHRLAGHWLRLDPANREAKRVYLGSLLQFATYQTGLDKPLPAGQGNARDHATKFGAATIEDLLIDSLINRRMPAAAAAAAILGDLGDESLLRGKGGKPSPLVQAAGHGDRRVRLAAVGAILKIAPKKPFAFSHTVPQTLAFLAGTAGSLKVLVADADVTEARRMAGLLAELDYEAEIAISARQMVKQSITSPDLAFVLFNTSLPYSNPDLLIQRLRAEPRTADMPVGFITADARLAPLERLTKKYPRTSVFVRTRSVEGMRFLVKQLMDTVGRDFFTLAERQAQAKQSLVWLAGLTAEEESLYDFRPYDEMIARALPLPELGPLAAEVLANLNTAYSQQALVDVAGTTPLPLPVRQAAAAAFRKNYDQHGLLLTSKEILRQYDRYNASQFLDKETQQVLGSILDVIDEAFGKKKKKE